jgi:hypothetical protein
MKIFKYKIEPMHIGIPIPVDVPKDAQILDVAFQYEGPPQFVGSSGVPHLVMWAMHDQLEDRRIQEFFLAFTGQSLDFPEGQWQFLRTLVSNGFVFHVFYRKD